MNTNCPDALEQQDVIDAALTEDIGAGDLSSLYFIPEDSVSTAHLVAKQNCHLAGLEVACEVFRRVDAALNLTTEHKDGDILQPRETVLTISGATRSILTAERTALNFIQQLSGVATHTALFVDAIAGTKARILDTRKTIPGLRLLQKAAVLAGGGCNHRMGLFDRVMIKDNHLAACASIEELANQILQFRYEHPTIKVEIEADTVEQAFAFYRIPGVDIVLLDNMSLEELQICVQGKPKAIEVEASGGITLETVRAVAETGVDWISVGALTHSSIAIDFGLDF